MLTTVCKLRLRSSQLISDKFRGARGTARLPEDLRPGLFTTSKDRAGGDETVDSLSSSIDSSWLSTAEAAEWPSEACLLRTEVGEVIVWEGTAVLEGVVFSSKSVDGSCLLSSSSPAVLTWA